MRALKNTKLLPWKFSFKIYSISKNGDLSFSYACPECLQKTKTVHVCKEHGQVKPIKLSPDGHVLTQDQINEIKGKMDNFETVGQIHLASIPSYCLGKTYSLYTEQVKFLQLLLMLRKNSLALIVKGTIRQGIKHFIIYVKKNNAFLQELTLPKHLELKELDFSNIEKKENKNILPKKTNLFSLKEETPKERYRKFVQSLGVA